MPVGEAVFVDSVPARITMADFRRFHLQSFPQLADSQYDDIITDAIDAVYAMFTGVKTLWDMEPKQVWHEKTVLCYRLLVAWYIADLYPGFVAGVSVMGGIPLKRKKVDGVDITFSDAGAGDGNKDYLDLLASLKSNPFGVKARLMITTAAKRALLYNCRFV
jgi:hypothetical protein